ncbi:MAG: aminopeptidase [Candidatus Pacearchaeota archaeon]
MPVDLRARKLAQLTIRECIKAKKGDKIIISGGSEAIPFLVELYKEVILQKAIPIVRVGLPDVNDFFFKYATKEQLEHFPDYWFETVKQCQGYVGVDTEGNTRELSNCDPKKVALRGKVLHKISDYICNEKDKIKRVTVAFPCIALAQEAEMSLTEYENFVYGATIGVDWNSLRKLMKKILSLFREGSKVHLIGENVDLEFFVHGEKAKDDLDFDNMPAGEIFMAPFRESLNGWIKFEYPSIRGGKEVKDIFLKFKDGKVIEFHATKNEDFLREMLTVDENASYVGEFGIGCNPKIHKYTNNLLFDEKIEGTIHLALGMAYKENGGGNDSAIHWDLVKDMKNAKIVVDGKVIQEKGKWKV